MDLVSILASALPQPLPFPADDQPRAERMCLLLAEDRLTDRAIAEDVGISTSTLWHWKRKPECQARIKLYQQEMATHAFRQGIAQRENRLGALADRWKRMHALMEARAQAYDSPEIPGGSTGLIVEEVKVSPKGDKTVVYSFDRALFQEMRETEKQAAIELGQWTEKRANLNVNVDTGEEHLTDEQAEAIRRFLTAPSVPANTEDVSDS
jgi:16S rRNA A1518/A1519 N6-dimethyltransferase RsmA/KsgA/DIM1 with predicted DNA glycosylase/AP lyase activity